MSQIMDGANDAAGSKSFLSASHSSGEPSSVEVNFSPKIMMLSRGEFLTEDHDAAGDPAGGKARRVWADQGRRVETLSLRLVPQVLDSEGDPSWPSCWRKSGQNLDIRARIERDAALRGGAFGLLLWWRDGQAIGLLVGRTPVVCWRESVPLFSCEIQEAIFWGNSTRPTWA